MLNKYPNAASVENALDKGIAAYNQSEQNKTDILSVKEDLSKYNEVTYQINHEENAILVEQKPNFTTADPNARYNDIFVNGDTCYLVAKITGEISDVETNVYLRTALSSSPWTTTKSNVVHLFAEYYYAECVYEQLNADGYMTLTNLSESSTVEWVVLSKEGYAYPNLSCTCIIDEETEARIAADTQLQNAITAQQKAFSDCFITEKSENIFDKSQVIVGKYIRSDNNGDIEYVENNTFECMLLAVEPNTTYTVTGVSYSVYGFDTNNKYTGAIKSISVSTPNVQFTTQQNTKYVSINYKPNSFDKETFMIVKGDTLPDDYIPFYSKTLLDKKFLDDTFVNDVYTVGTGKDFATFTECIRALKDVETPKTILIDGGRYNIFEEIGGSTYTQSIESGTKWAECNDIIPPNTTVRGLGTVIFEFKPTAEEIGEVAMGLISPLNIVNGNVRIENIIVDALNCRYAIHDDGSSVDTNSVHEYINVKVKKRSGGYGQACGFGIGKNCNFVFRDCIIDSNVSCFTIHNQSYAYSGSILFDGVVFRCSGENAVGFRSLSSQTEEYHIDVKLVNCFVTANSKVYLRRETSGSGATNPYLVTVVKCSNIDNIDTSDYTDLQLAPIIYS